MAKDCCNHENDEKGVATLLQSAKWVLWIALVSNFVMFAVEIGTSLRSHSESLKADAIDFLGDSLSYGITLFVLRSSTKVRNRSAYFKAYMMLAMGVWVLGSAIYRALYGVTPDAYSMGSIGIAALIVNLSVALLLYRFRGSDMNMRSVWLCSRNDALGNVAVILAALGVWGTNTRWPDLIVASIISALNLSGSFVVIQALRSGQQPDEHAGHGH
jgi:Co/Zn/Cd efflux system component